VLATLHQSASDLGILKRRQALAEIGEDRRVNIILTNDQPALWRRGGGWHSQQFPQGPTHCGNGAAFPPVDHAAVETRRRPAHGTLFGDGIQARIKTDLLEKFNLRTDVRLREGVFAPYTDIPANLIFFDTTGPTKDIWYSEMPLPEGRKKYLKTAPMAYEEFAGWRLVICQNGAVAELTFPFTSPARVIADHRVVPENFRGNGAGADFRRKSLPCCFKGQKSADNADEFAPFAF
jgi:hypothetical protein